MIRSYRYWPVIIIAFCSVIPLWRAVFLGQVIGPFDQIRHMAPWNGPEPNRPFDVLQADSVLQFYPWRDLVFRSWSHGQLPAWNPYELAGTPLLANSQSAALYPPHILIGLLHIPTGIAITFLAWLHLFWAGLGAFYLCRRLGGGNLAATTAGSAFCLSAFMVAWTPLASVITTVAWIPWILGLIGAQFGDSLALAHDGGYRERRRARLRYAGLTVCTAMMFLGGHLQFCAYGCIAAAIMLFWMWAVYSIPWGKSSKTKIERSSIPTAIAALLFGVLLSAPQLLPVLSYGRFSHRANTPTAQGYEAYAKAAPPLETLQALAFPTALGNPAKPSPLIKNVNDYWPQLTNIGMDFAESAFGLGPLVFLLLFCLRTLKGGRAALAAIGAFALLAALGSFVDWPLYFLIPGWSATGSPGRAAVLFVLAACVLGGLAVDDIPKLQGKPLALTLSVGGLIGLILALAPLIFGMNYSSPLASSEQVSAAIRASVSGEFPAIAATLLISILVIAAYRYKAEYSAAIPIGVALCAFAGYGWNLLPTSDSPLPPLGADRSQRYAFVNADWGLWTPSRALMPPNTGIYSGLEDIGGYDSLLHRDSVAMLRAIDGEDPAPASNGNMMLVKPKANPALLEEAGVTRVWSLGPLNGLGSAVSVGGLLQYSLPGRGRIYASGPVRVESETLDSLTVSATGPGQLVDKDRMMPGWTATIDGKPSALRPLDSPLGKGLWRELDLLPGKHEVHFHYDPPGFKSGLGLALLSLIWIGFLLIPTSGGRIAIGSN